MKTQRKFLVGALFLIAAGVLTTSAQAPAKLPADVNPKSLARLPYLDRKNMSEADQKTLDPIKMFFNSDGQLAGPLAWASYNPAVAKALYDLHNGAYAGILTPHVRELAIMVACRETNYNLEWNGHEKSARDAGVDAKTLEIIRNKGALTGVPEADATVIRFGRQMLTDKKVDSATFAKAVEQLTQRGVMDMVAVMNTYAVSGFYAIAVDEKAPAGKPAF